MKFSVVTDVLGTESFEEALDIAKQLGFSLVDIRSKMDGNNIDNITLDKAIELRGLLDSKGLQVSCLTSWAINPISFTGGPPSYDNYDELFHAKMLKELERLCDLADIFNTTYIRIYSLSRPEGFDQLSAEDKELLYKHNGAIMRRHAELASTRNKILLIENEPPSLTNCAKELGTMIRYANHPNLKVNWDIINEWIGGQYATVEAYELIKDAVHQVHIKGGFKAAGSEDELNPHGKFGRVGIAGKDDYDHLTMMQAITSYNPNLMITFDTHYFALDESDKLGEIEVVRQSKRYIESLFDA
jgi:3-dehydroshikimate dehydratase